MTTFTIPSSISVRGPAKSIKEVDTSIWTPEYVLYMLQYAWDVRMQRCTAGADKDSDDFHKKEAAMFASMTQGLVPTKGGSTSSSIEDRADSQYLTAQGLKGKIAGLAPRWLEFAKATVLNSVEDSERAALQSDPVTLEAMAEEYLDEVKKSARESAAWIKIEQDLKKPKAAPKPGLKISLK